MYSTTKLQPSSLLRLSESVTILLFIFLDIDYDIQTKT